MFYVAVGNNWCNAAPQSWVDTTAKICRWPLSNVSKAIWLNLEPDDSWEWHELKHVLGPYKSFGAAKEAEINAQSLTSDDSDMDDLESATPRNQIKSENNVNYEFDDEEASPNDDNDDDVDFDIEYEDKLESNYKKKSKAKTVAKRKSVSNAKSGRGRKKQNAKPTTTKKRINKRLNATNASEDGNFENSEDRKQQPFKKRKIASKETVELEAESILGIMPPLDNQGESFIIESGPSSQWESQSNIDSQSDNSHIEVLLQCMNRKLDLILGYLHHKEQLKELKNMADQLPSFPLTTVEEFEKLCIDLKENEELRNQFNNKIIKIGGQTGESHLTNILVTTITNKLGKSLTWEGQRDTYGIKDTTFASIILGVLLQVHSEATHDALKKCFGEWLRRSGDRYRYHFKLGRES